MSIISNLRRKPQPSWRHLCCSLHCVNSLTVNIENPPSVFIPKKTYSRNPDPTRCKVAVITGGVRGIGYKIAEGLLDFGTKSVIFGDAQTDDCKKAVRKLNEKYGEPRAFFHTCDITDKSDMEALFKSVKDKFKKIDFVINNADINEDWDKTLFVNLNGLVRGTLLGFQYMSTQSGGRGGCIINISSILGLQPHFAAPIYSGTKCFGIGFTRSMGDDYFYEKSRVKVMTLCPGITETTKNRRADLPGFEDLASKNACSFLRLPSQDLTVVGEGVLTMLENGENGSVWVSEGKDFYKARIPDRRTLRVCKEADDGCGQKRPCKINVPTKKKKDKCEKEEKKAPCDKVNPCRKPNNSCK